MQECVTVKVSTTLLGDTENQKKVINMDMVETYVVKMQQELHYTYAIDLLVKKGSITMTTNQIKKGTTVRLNHLGPIVTGKILDSVKGNIRFALVNGSEAGLFDEAGSVYSYNIISAKNDKGEWEMVEHTDKQLKLQQRNQAMGF